MESNRGKKTVRVIMALALFASVRPVGATEKCRLALVKEAAKITQTSATLLQKCEEAVRVGKGTGPCPDSATVAKLAAAKAKTSAAAAKKCATSVGEFNYGSCPNAQGPNGTATCGALLIDGKAAEGECLACLAEEHAREMTRTSYGAFVAAGGDKTLGKCQAAIGKSSAAFFVARSKILAKCQASLIAGKVAGPCPEGEQKTADALEKARAKMEVAICEACGGDDERCDGVDDLSPAAIGFAAACPRLYVDTREGEPLGEPTTDLRSLLACLETRTIQRTSCTDVYPLPWDGPSLLFHPCEAAPSSCVVDGGTATVRVAIANASGRDLAGISISLGYRGVRVPGTGESSSDYVTNLQGGLMVSGDHEAALTVSIVSLDGLVDGGLFDVAVGTCAEPDGFGCVVRGAADTLGNEIVEHLTCTATVL